MPDVDNARSWDDATVYVAFKDGGGQFPALPATITDPMPAGWDEVGLLDGNQGFTEGLTETVTDTFAWGQRLVQRRRSDQVVTKTFTAMETNEATDRLQHIREDNGELKQFLEPPEQVLLCFEKQDAARGVTERQITAAYAEVAVNGDKTENETTPKSVPFIATIYPDADKALFVVQRSADSGS